MLGEFEQVVLLAVVHAADEAYGVPVRDEIERRTGRSVTLGAIYKTLGRLEEKGHLRSRLGDPTAERGGRRTRCYELTASGKRALRSAVTSLRNMTAGLDMGLEPR